MANETMRFSPSGMAAVRRYEGRRKNYYPDQANNCTVGIGVLVHPGPCTSREQALTVTDTQIERGLAARIQSAETTVRQQVARQPLNQAQFDSLVTYTFNSGRTGARAVLHAADRGSFKQVVQHMQSRVYVHPKHADGRRGPAEKSNGLINRRREESAPFQAQSSAR